MVRRFVMCAVVLGTAAALLTGTPAAQAKTKSLSFSFVHSKVTANTRPRLRVASHGYGKKVVLHLQRQMGTRHVYRNVAKLHVKRGLVTAPEVPMGRYAYRIVAKKGKKVVRVSAAHTLYSYGTLSLWQLCDRDDHLRRGLDGYCPDVDTVQVGGRVFSYVAEGTGDGPDSSYALAAQRSSCRSVSLRFAIDNDADSRSYGVALSQENADQQTATGTYGNIASAHFSIGSGAWDLVTWSNDGDWVYFNGFLSCYTSTGER